ncbi:MAG: hypothetical protein RIM99_00885 [Cyclobacteriaceae bacterium]
MVKKFVFIAFSVILFAGCNTNELDFDNIKVPPVTGIFSVPIGEVSYTMRDLLLKSDSTLDFQVDEDSLVTLMYFDTISYQSDTDFLQIDDITNSATVDLAAIPGGPFTGIGVTVPINSTFTLSYEANDANDVIDEVFYEAGDVTISVTTDIQGTLDYTVTLNSFVTAVNEIPLTVSETINGNGTLTTTNSAGSLVNHKSLINNKTFVTDFAGTLTLGAGDTFTGSETLTVDITFANQTFSIVYGRFGQDTVQVGNETLDIEFFRQTGDDGLFFGNPTIRFNFENTLGIPLGIDFSGLYGDDGQGGAQTFLEGDITETIPVIEMSDINDPGSVVSSTIEITKGNSSIVDLLATSPARLGFDVMAISNPYDVNTTNFITQDNRLEGTIEIEIPMEVRLENLQQTVNLSLGDGFDLSDVDSAAIRIVTINELPFSAILALEIQDADSNALYTVTDNLFLNAPFININGLVTDPNGASADIPLTKAGVEALGSPEGRMVLTVTLNTPGSLNSRDIFVKILTNYSLEVKVGVVGKVNIDL